MSAIYSWITAHSAVLSALAVAIIDFVFAVAPNLKSNGILHSIYLFFGGKE